MAKQKLNKGIFVTFEGPEGCGKSTQSKLLYDYLKTHSYDCVYTREPGGTPLGDHIRHILLHASDIKITDLAELFLFEASRAQIVNEIIRPNLERKRMVICDRFGDATTAYQGYGGGLHIKLIKRLNDLAAGGLGPDLTILLDVDTATGLTRARSKGVDRMEKKDVAYHRRVRSGYLKLAKENPSRIKVIRVSGGIKAIQVLIRNEVDRVIQRYKRTG